MPIATDQTVAATAQPQCGNRPDVSITRPAAIQVGTRCSPAAMQITPAIPRSFSRNGRTL